MLKKFIFTLFLFITPFISIAQESESVRLQLPAGFISKTCATPAWDGTPVIWKGVKDKRATEAVGTQTKKGGKDPVEVFANPPLTQVFNSAFKQLLPACGLKLVGPDTPDALELTVEINDFGVVVEKKLLTGKAEAKSQLTFVGQKSGETTMTVDMGFTMENKKMRSKSLKQLEATLNELLAETLTQVPLTKQLQNL